VTSAKLWNGWLQALIPTKTSKHNNEMSEPNFSALEKSEVSSNQVNGRMMNAKVVNLRT